MFCFIYIATYPHTISLNASICPLVKIGKLVTRNVAISPKCDYLTDFWRGIKKVKQKQKQILAASCNIYLFECPNNQMGACRNSFFRLNAQKTKTKY